jgi:hypothetical protein
MDKRIGDSQFYFATGRQRLGRIDALNAALDRITRRDGAATAGFIALQLEYPR